MLKAYRLQLIATLRPLYHPRTLLLIPPLLAAGNLFLYRGPGLCFQKRPIITIQHVLKQSQLYGEGKLVRFKKLSRRGIPSSQNGAVDKIVLRFYFNTKRLKHNKAIFIKL